MTTLIIGIWLLLFGFLSLVSTEVPRWIVPLAAVIGGLLILGAYWKRGGAALLLILALLSPVALTTGCKNPTQQKLAVNTITSTHQAVDFLLDSYLDLVVAKQIPTNSVPTVLQSYATYQSAYNAALVIVLGNTNAPAPPALSDAAANFTSTVTAAKKGSL